VVADGIRVASNWPPENAHGIPTGPILDATFAPGGLVVIEQFEYTRGNRSPVVGAFVPIHA